MSQSEDKKDRKNLEVKEEQEENRLPVGELKWSKEQKEDHEKEETKVENKELDDQDKKEEQTPSKNNVHSEISATLLDLDVEREPQTKEAKISSDEELEIEKDKKQDPLANIEDTLTPIDFKTYEFDADQLKAIEQELNALNPQKLEEELQTLHQEEPAHYHHYVEEDEEEEVESASNNKWLTRSIWVIGVPALLVIVLFVSLIIGHTVIGGQPASDIFDMGMWMHVYNLIYS